MSLLGLLKIGIITRIELLQFMLDGVAVTVSIWNNTDVAVAGHSPG